MEKVSAILPDGVYSDGDVRLMLSVTDAALTRARRAGRLRFMRAGRCVLYRGRWLLDWLESEADASKGGAP